MSERNRGVGLSLGVTVALGLSAIFYVGWTTIELKTEQRVSEHYAGQHEATDAAREIDKICSAETGLVRAECFIEQVKRQQERDNDSRDLNAQEWMAHWALWMFIAAGFGTIAAIYGIVLLRATWFEAKRTADATLTALKLSHPPRFKVTRVLAYVGSEFDLSTPSFVPGEKIFGTAFAVNYGRFTAKLFRSDCRFVWATKGILPMNHAYFWMRDSANFINLTEGGHGSQVKAEMIRAGQPGRWSFQTEVPQSFEIKSGRWSHDLLVVGLVSYHGEANDPRAYYFCKRYVPEHEQFEDAEEYENED